MYSVHIIPQYTAYSIYVYLRVQCTYSQDSITYYITYMYSVQYYFMYDVQYGYVCVQERRGVSGRESPESGSLYSDYESGQQYEQEIVQTKIKKIKVLPGWRKIFAI
jgi:hypothetical protein